MATPASKQSAIALWLLPAAPAREQLRDVIARLAAECDAPIFEPHLTLGVTDDAAELRLGLTNKPITLRALGVFWSDAFTRTLFIRFAATPDLAALRESLGMRTGDYDPHVSLLYKDMTAKRKAELASSIAPAFSAATFEALQAVRCPIPTATRADVESWKMVASRKLYGDGRCSEEAKSSSMER